MEGPAPKGYKNPPSQQTTMPVWAYYLDEFRLVSDYDFDYTINELIGIAINEAERHGLKPTTICH